MAENIQNTDEKAVATRDNAPVPAETRDNERYLVPAVDIYETDDGLTLVADVPGVDQGGLDIRVEDGLLTIKAKTDYRPRDDSYYNEFTLANYWRQFRLSDEVDTEKISAELKHGVLKLVLPKAEKARPRKIEVNVG